MESTPAPLLPYPLHRPRMDNLALLPTIHVGHQILLRRQYLDHRSALKVLLVPGNDGHRISNFGFRIHFRALLVLSLLRRSLAVLPDAVKIARSSPDSCRSHSRSWGLPMFASTHSSSQYCVSAASFSTLSIVTPALPILAETLASSARQWNRTCPGVSDRDLRTQCNPYPPQQHRPGTCCHPDPPGWH